MLICHLSAIKAIPVPDVSGQIDNHNTSTYAHDDIRKIIKANTDAITDKISYKNQILTEDQKAQARINIGAMSSNTLIPSVEGLATEEYVNQAVAQKSQVQIITWEADD